MLTLPQLLAREKSLRGEKVLSVYVTAWSDDPGRRNAWHIELKNALEEKRAQLRQASHAEREAFDAAVAHLREHLNTAATIAGDPGWVAFVTATGVQYAEAVPVALPLWVEWGEGVLLAPYIRVLKQSRAAIVALTDARAAHVYRYQGGRLRKVDKLHSHKHREAPQHMGSAPRMGFHPGTRGTTGSEEADRAQLAGRNAMLHELATLLVRESTPDAWILIGGIPGVVDAAYNALPEHDRRRARRLTSLDVHSSEADIAAAAERGATEASRERDAAFVGEILTLTGAYGKGLTGWEGTREALRQGAVDRLCFTDRFLTEHAIDVELGVALALDQHAEVEHVSGAGAALLDAEGAGIGVRLRFLPSREQAPMAASTATG